MVMPPRSRRTSSGTWTELRKGAPDTEILCWDTIATNGIFLTVLADAEAAPYISGVAWHLYNGSPEAMSKVWAHYPEKKVYFTEHGFPHMTISWAPCRGIREHRHRHPEELEPYRLEWNLASDPRYALHTRSAPGSPRGVTIGHHKHRAARGSLGRRHIEATIERNPGYYLMAHSARFIRPGAVRVHSSEVDSFQRDC